jgi:hypothetical protein
MQTFSRETIVDRRQPAVRWSAVFSGAAVAAGTWLVLQLLFTGGALAGLDPDDLEAARLFGIGTTAGTLLAALVALFLGGLVAGRLAGHFDRKVAGMHGLLVWAITAVAGIVLIASSVNNLADGYHAGASVAPPPPGSARVLETTLEGVNERLVAEGRPPVSRSQFLDAARYATRPDGTTSAASFVARLDLKTDLSRADAEAVVRQLGDRANATLALGNAIAEHRAAAIAAASATGTAMVAAGISLFLCLVASLCGALLATRRLPRPARPTTEPGYVTSPPSIELGRD